MTGIFYISAAIAIVATLLTITCRSTVHALLYLVISLLAVAVMFFLLGAPFVAALEVIIYAGAIMVLFIFVVMLLNLDGQHATGEGLLAAPSTWAGPAALAAILVAEVVILMGFGMRGPLSGVSVDPKPVALALYRPYLIGVELASFLLMAGVVGAYHLGARHASRGASMDRTRELKRFGDQAPPRIAGSGAGVAPRAR